jgi:hypothetical protein
MYKPLPSVLRSFVNTTLTTNKNRGIQYAVLTGHAVAFSVDMLFNEQPTDEQKKHVQDDIIDKVGKINEVTPLMVDKTVDIAMSIYRWRYDIYRGQLHIRTAKNTIAYLSGLEYYISESDLETIDDETSAQTHRHIAALIRHL